MSEPTWDCWVCGQRVNYDEHHCRECGGVPVCGPIHQIGHARAIAERLACAAAVCPRCAAGEELKERFRHGGLIFYGSFSVVRPGSIGAQIVKRERRPELVFWRGRRFAPLSRVSPADIGDGTRRRRRA